MRTADDALLRKQTTALLLLRPGQMDRGQTRDEFAEPVQCVGKFFAYGCEAKAKMRRHVKTIPGCEQDALFCGGLAKGAAVFAALQPRKYGHSTTRRNPADRFTMPGHEGVKVAKVFSRSFLRFAEHDVAVARRDFGQSFSGGVVGDGKIGACIPVALAAAGVMLNHPSGSDAG